MIVLNLLCSYPVEYLSCWSELCCSIELVAVLTVHCVAMEGVFNLVCIYLGVVLNFASIVLCLYWTSKVLNLFVLNLLVLNFWSIELCLYWTLIVLNFKSIELCLYWTLCVLNLKSIELICIELVSIDRPVLTLLVFNRSGHPILGIKCPEDS